MEREVWEDILLGSLLPSTITTIVCWVKQRRIVEETLSIEEWQTWPVGVRKQRLVEQEVCVECGRGKHFAKKGYIK